jgi:flagellar biosynthesis protein FliQ
MLILIGVPVLVIILIVLFFIFAWIEEHYISRFVNTLVEKAIKEDPD